MLSTEKTTREILAALGDINAIMDIDDIDYIRASTDLTYGEKFILLYNMGLRGNMLSLYGYRHKPVGEKRVLN